MLPTKFWEATVKWKWNEEMKMIPFFKLFLKTVERVEGEVDIFLFVLDFWVFTSGMRPHVTT